MISKIIAYTYLILFGVFDGWLFAYVYRLMMKRISRLKIVRTNHD